MSMSKVSDPSWRCTWGTATWPSSPSQSAPPPRPGRSGGTRRGPGRCPGRGTAAPAIFTRADVSAVVLKAVACCSAALHCTNVRCLCLSYMLTRSLLLNISDFSSSEMAVSAPRPRLPGPAAPSCRTVPPPSQACLSIDQTSACILTTSTFCQISFHKKVY